MGRRLVGALLPVGAFSAAYAAAIVLGRATRVEGSQVSLIWPAAAVAVLWGLHAHGLRPLARAAHWSTLVALTFTVNLTTGAEVGLAAWFVTVNVALAAISSAILCRGGREVRLKDPADLGRLVAAVTVAAVVAASLAALWFATHGDESPLMTFALFAVRNGVTAVAGVAVVLRLRDAGFPARRSPGHVLEAVGCAVVTVVVLLVGFTPVGGPPAAFIVMLPALWVSLRFSTTTGTLFLLACGAAIVGATLADEGAFAGHDAITQAMLAQALVGSLTLVVLTLALYRDSRNALIEQLRHLAHHDPLTGVANRTLLVERLERALERRQPDGSRPGVIYIDLDGFKLVNDAWGHREGDLLLIEIAARIRHVVGPACTVARFGGDEFVVAVPAVASDDALHTLAEKVRTFISQPYGDAGDAPFDRITASVGTAIAARSTSARHLIAEADRAMYVAKKSGRDRTRRAPDPAAGSSSDASLDVAPPSEAVRSA